MQRQAAASGNGGDALRQQQLALQAPHLDWRLLDFERKLKASYLCCCAVLQYVSLL
jgi:hypothetical protein